MKIRSHHAREGVWLYDHEGRAYLDAYNNVPSVGHHPRVVDAVARQAAQLNTHALPVRGGHAYAERLLATFPEALSNLLFTSSGTESVDLALRMARYHTGGAGFIVTRFAYHGHSTAVAEITPAFGPGVPLASMCARCPRLPGRNGEDVGQAFAADIEQAIADLRHGIRFAGAIFDSIFSSDGPPTARLPRGGRDRAAPWRRLHRRRCSRASAAPAPACGASAATASRPTWW